MAGIETIHAVVSFRGGKIDIHLKEEETVGSVKAHVVEQSNDPSLRVADIKLLWKGKVLADDTQDLRRLLLLSSSSKSNKDDRHAHTSKTYRLVATGVSFATVNAMNHKLQVGVRTGPRIRDDLTNAGQREIEQRQRLGRAMMDHAAMNQNKKSKHQEAESYGFGKIEVLPHLPDQDQARSILTTLANDPGILGCMRKHKWYVGSLAELYPEGKVGESAVCVMGLNQNKGQQILLRIRTDDLQGFRKILNIRKVFVP